MEKIIKKIALIGASANKNKYGYKILIDLVSKGYNVLPVHPALSEIEGIKVYNSAENIDEEPDLSVFVVPPSVGLEVTKKLYKKGYRKFWYQPGAESEEIKGYLNEVNDVKYSTIRCIMMSTLRSGDLSF